MLKQLMKKAFHVAGLKVEFRDRLAEQIPGIYHNSIFLPSITRGTLSKAIYFHELFRRTRDVEGDVVECGVCIGYSLLIQILLSDFEGLRRTFWGYDSFAGLPAPTGNDGKSGDYNGYLATTPEVVLKVLRDGGVTEGTIRDHLRLTRGFFENTVPHHQGRIAVLHLDCDLYDSYKVCLESLYDKVVPGGVILLDEYGDPNWPGADRAVDEFLSDKPSKLEQHPLGKWYIIKRE